MKKFIKRLVRKFESSEIMANSIYSLASKASNMFFFFLLDILCARLLNADLYGEWVYFYAIITIVYSVVWFGVNISAKIFIAKSEESKQMEVFLSSLILRFGVSVAFTMIYAFIVILLNKLDILDIQKYEHIYSMLLIGGVIVFLNSFSEFFKEVFIGLVNFKGLFVVNLCEYAGYFVFGTIGLICVENVYGIIYGFIFSLIIAISAGFWIVIKKYNLTSVKFNKKVSCEKSKQIFHYAKYIAISGIGTIVLTEIDTFMIGYFREGYDTAIYSIAKQLSSKAIHVNLALSTSMMPIFANITSANVKSKKIKFKKVMLYNSVVTFCITVFFVLIGKYAIRLLYGEQYIYAANVLNYLLPFYIISSFSKFLVLFLDYQNKAKIRSIVFTATVLADIILNMILIPQMGAVGASIATDIALMPYFVFLIIEVGIIFKGYSKNEKNYFIG